MKIIIAILALAAVVGGGCYWYTEHYAVAPPSYRTATIKRKDVRATIPASGTIEPVETIDVGAQVEGLIMSFGQDLDGKPVDYRSRVDENTILATVDPSLYQADLDTAKAQLNSAESSVGAAQANLEELQAKLHQAEDDWNRAQELHPSHAIADTDYDNYQATYLSAKSAVDVGQAAIVQAQAMVEQDKAALFKAQKNMDYCTIKSPVKGEIIDRRVTLGETVVSSLNAPSLFLIATDLTKMQIWTSVNEVDIGRIHPGQPVTFSVGAYPDRTFSGVVNKIRLNATVSQNVVTYTVEVDFDNKDELLLPYLTANVQFETGRSENVLTVPTAALRWSPESAMADASGAATGGAGGGSMSSDAGSGATTQASGGKRGGRGGGRAGAALKPGTIWLWDGANVKEAAVKVGLNDDTVTEVSGDTIHEGDEVIIGQDFATTSDSTSNPFLPQGMFGRGGGRGPGGGGG
jgi:HlyD family secretion protein